jgi:Ti-type conjugative transfer relaxase TraA
MAIYHFSAKMISRANGSSALAAAAYRSASRLHDQRLDRHHDFSNKAGVVHSEVMLPDGAPEEYADREKLWNAVEAAELRKDAQLAREIGFAIPRELDQAEGIRLAREYVQAEFVDKGMIADLNVHWDVGADGLAKPHAHVMLTTRSVDEDGFGPKVRDWNATALLERWRERWGDHVNTRLAELDIDARVDHRSLEAQGIDLEPQHKIGPAASRMRAQGLESERLAEHVEIARSNGEKIFANPGIALDAITRQQATFTNRDLAMFVHRHSEGKDQFDAVMAAVRASPDLVALGSDGRGEQRFSSRDMIETEQRLERATTIMAERAGHGLPAATIEQAIAAAGSDGLMLGGEQRAALEHILQPRDLGIVIGYAGTGKSAMLSVARDGWEQAGYRVTGLALSGIAAENLESGSGIASRTIASLEHQWGQGRERLTPNHILVIDEAGMIGSRQMERIVREAEQRGAKLVLVGDPEQLQAIEAGAAFRSINERHGGVEITEVRRQREDWQRDATRQLATGRTGEALRAYEEAGHVHVAATREVARADLVARWDRARQAAPGETRMILTHTRDEVAELNQLARGRLRASGQLGEDMTIDTARGPRNFADGDRVMFLRNERGLGVKNGSLGTIESVTATRMAVLMDDGRNVAFDVKDYADVDHGYAATIHKSQGVTVDHAHVLATPGLDRHAAYVALSRHRTSVELHYGQDDFADQDRLVHTLGRERAKDMASDYDKPFADRRQSVGAAEKSASREPPNRNLFAGLARHLETMAVERPPRNEIGPTPIKAKEPVPDLSAAVSRHGRIVHAIRFARSVGDLASPEQKAELAGSRAALDRITPNGSMDLETAFSVDRGLIAEASAGRTTAVIRAMQLEAEMRDNPHLRADTFVQRWQSLERQRRLLVRDHEDSRAERVAQAMAGMAKGLERDPQVESLLRSRKAEFGLPPMSDRSVAQSLGELIGRGRSRGLGIGM